MKTSSVFCLALVLAAARASGASIGIENDTLSVSYDDVSRSFSMVEKSSGKVVLREGGLLQPAADAAKAVATADRAFGAGRGIQIKYSDGAVSSLELYRGLPFLLVRTTLHNMTASAVDIARIVPMTTELDLDKPAGELKTLGTGGLLAPDQNPGSYLFLTCADPETRRGIVAGWLTENRGSGIVFSEVKDDRVSFKARIDYGHLPIPAGQTAQLETFAIGAFDDARLGEEQFADAIQKQYAIKLNPQVATYCTWYAEGPGHGGAGNEKTTLELAQFAAKELKPFGLGVVQIDDQWQDGPSIDGPRRGFERARPDGPYPHGMTPLAAQLSKLGMRLGLWWLPFGRNHTAPDFKERQDWFVTNPDGTVLRTHSFGGTCLDLTNPKVQAHLASIARSYRQWGISYFKMDGLFTGLAVDHVYINDGYKEDNFGNCLPFHDPAATPVQAYRSGLMLLRRNAGDSVFFSGCCASQNMRSLCGAIGLVDSMRVGPDFNHDGQGTKTGPLRASRLYFMNGRVWWNDPDPTKVRTSNANCEGDPACNGAVSLEQARLTSSWVALTGQFFLVSDWLPSLPPERLEILKRTMQHHGATARPVDYFDTNLPTTWLVTDTHGSVRRDVIGVFNQESSDLHVDYTAVKLGLDPANTYYGFDFWDNQPVPPFKGEFKADVPAHSCRVVGVRAVEDHPILVSTSRHVTQGIVDVTGESWSKDTLSATSEVIAGDPYELRIMGLNDGGHHWALVSAEAGAEEKTAGVKVSVKEDANLLRVTIRSSVTRAVEWTIQFQPQPLMTGERPITHLEASQNGSLDPVTLSWEGGAMFYNIVRDGKPIASAHYGLSYTDETAVPGATCQYVVTPWTQSALPDESGASLSVQCKPLALGSQPPVPAVSLMSLPPLSAVVGWGAMQKGKSIEGHPLTLGSNIYADGVGLHANAEVVYDRKPEWKRFVAITGIDEEVRQENQSSLICEVVSEDASGECITLAKSPVLRFGKMEQWYFDLKLPDSCRKLHLVVDDAGDGIASDHADWVNAGFLEK